MSQSDMQENYVMNLLLRSCSNRTTVAIIVDGKCCNYMKLMCQLFVNQKYFTHKNIFFVAPFVPAVILIHITEAQIKMLL